MAAKPILPQHQEFLDEHFGGMSPQWKKFHRNLRSPQFVDTVRQDTRSDRKLRRFSKMVGLRQQSKQPGLSARGDSGKSYRIKFHPEAKRFSCSCKDWTYRRSVKNRGKSGDCKHINRMKSTMKQGLTKTAFLGPARLARGFYQEEKNKDEATKEKIRNKAYEEHFKRPSLLREFVFGKKAAAVRGRAAVEFRDRLRQLMG